MLTGAGLALNRTSVAVDAWAAAGLPGWSLAAAGWVSGLTGLYLLNGGLRLPRPLIDSPPSQPISAALYSLSLAGICFFLRWIFGGILFWTALPLLGVAHAAAEGSTGRRRRLELVLLYLLVPGFGVAGLWNFVGHFFMSDTVAASVGWAAGSPFQHELAFAQLGMGVAGLLCLWIRDRYWIAVALPWCIFLYGAAWVHVREYQVAGNTSPANWGFGMVFGNVLVPTILLATVAAYGWAGGWSQTR